MYPDVLVGVVTVNCHPCVMMGLTLSSDVIRVNIRVRTKCLQSNLIHFLKRYSVIHN